MAVVEYETHLPCSVEGLFDFLARPQNAALVTQPALGLTFDSAPEVVELGSRLEFKMIAHGHVVQLCHEIIQFDRPHLVVEKQLTGPMRAWQQQHIYESTPEGVLMRDIVEFQGPGGLIGLLLSDQKIEDSLEEGFYYREQQLKELVDRGIIT